MSIDNVDVADTHARALSFRSCGLTDDAFVFLVHQAEVHQQVGFIKLVAPDNDLHTPVVAVQGLAASIEVAQKVSRRKTAGYHEFKQFSIPC